MCFSTSGMPIHGRILPDIFPVHIKIHFFLFQAKNAFAEFATNNRANIRDTLVEYEHGRTSDALIFSRIDDRSEISGIKRAAAALYPFDGCMY